MRRAWRCDCDGESHRDTRPAGHQAAKSIALMRKVVTEQTGHECSTCPWRAFYDPLVQFAWKLHGTDNATRAAYLGDDPPALWLDALLTYGQAFNAVKGQEEKRIHEEHMAKLKNPYG